MQASIRSLEGHRSAALVQRRWRWMGVAVMALSLLALAPGASAQRVGETQARQFISGLAERAALTLSGSEQSLAEREEALRELLKGGFAIPFIARLALGKHWKRVSGDDQATYLALFGEFLLRTYGSKLAAFDRDRFEVVGAAPRGKRDVVVQTRILQPNGPPIRAGWRVRLFGGEPRIIDILVEGVSMALNQRQEFNSVIAQSGMSGLMSMLRARTQRLPVEGPVEQTSGSPGSGSTPTDAPQKS